MYLLAHPLALPPLPPLSLVSLLSFPPPFVSPVIFASASLFVLAALVASVWQPDESRAEAAEQRAHASKEFDETHKRIGGVELVKIDLSDQRACGTCTPEDSTGERHSSSICALCADTWLCRTVVKGWRFARWLAGYDLYPLLLLNFYFRFSFAVYKYVILPFHAIR